MGFVSMFMDISSEMIHSLLPVFLVSVLGVSASALGFLEGAAEAVVLITKMGSGWLSDRIGKRKILALAGYGLAAATKPLFPLADSFATVFAARLLDRVGKGIRGAPRDALIADIAQKGARGASFGLRQSLDTVGAVAGPLVALMLMLASGGDFRLVFWLAVIPAVIAVLILALMVKEPPAVARAPRTRIDWRRLRDFPPAYWQVVGIGAAFTLARFSEAFLLLRAEDAGLALAYIPLVLVVMNLGYSFSAYPIGKLSDHIDRRRLLALGALTLIVADLLLGLGDTLLTLGLGIALWGLHLGFSQGVLAAMIADTAPEERRGTGFGLFNLVSGGVLLVASTFAGWLWDHGSPSATFLAGASFAALTLLLLGHQIVTKKAERSKQRHDRF